MSKKILIVCVIILAFIWLALMWPAKQNDIKNLGQIPKIENIPKFHELQKINIKNGIVYNDSRVFGKSYFLTCVIDESNFELLLQALDLYKSSVTESDLPRIFEFVEDQIRTEFVDDCIRKSFGKGVHWCSFEGMCSDIYWSGVYDTSEQKIYVYIGYK